MPGMMFQAICSMGVSPSNAIKVENQQQTNYASFGGCRAAHNPINLAKTAANLGVQVENGTCIPVIVEKGGGCSGCKCAWGGTITQQGPSTNF